MNEIAELASDLSRMADQLPRRARAVTARHVNAVRDTAQRDALSKWSRYGRGMEGSAGTIRARMARGDDPVGFVMLSGVGGIMQERGTSRHPPNPVLQPAAERHEETWLRYLSEQAEL